MFTRLHDPAEPVRLTVDGAEITAEAGETVAAVLLRTPPHFARTSPIGGGRRAPFCMMGVCFDCLAVIDGIPSVQSCLVPVREGMRVERQIVEAEAGA